MSAPLGPGWTPGAADMGCCGYGVMWVWGDVGTGCWHSSEQGEGLSRSLKGHGSDTAEVDGELLLQSLEGGLGGNRAQLVEGWRA